MLYFTVLHYVQVINIYFAFYLLTNPMKKGSPHFSDHGFQHLLNLNVIFKNGFLKDMLGKL